MEKGYMIAPGLPKKLTLAVIQQEVCREIGIEESQIEIKTRKGEIVKARQLCHYFAYHLFKNGKGSNQYKRRKGYTLQNIADFFGGVKSHVTVRHSVKTVKNDCFYNLQNKNQLEKLTKIFEKYEK